MLVEWLFDLWAWCVAHLLLIDKLSRAGTASA